MCVFCNTVATEVPSYNMNIETCLLDMWVDGSCIRNGLRDAAIGIGIVTTTNSPSEFSTAVNTGRQTNNRAELLAILYALCATARDTGLRIHTDSRYSINCVEVYYDLWVNNAWVTSRGTPVESQEIIKYIHGIVKDRRSRGVHTEFVHTRGHSTDVNNNTADVLARAAATTGIESKRVAMLRLMRVPF